jgi:hypothetical protein
MVNSQSVEETKALRPVMVRPESLAVTSIEMLRDDTLLWPATGFLYRYGQDLALVTSWHVFSGVNPNTREVRGTPNRVKFHINVFDQPEGRGGKFFARPVDLPLIVNDDPVWWEHPSEEVVDIAVLRLNDQITDCEEIKDRVSSLPATMVVVDYGKETMHATFVYPLVGSDVFILGYPQGLAKQGIFPIWKKGSIASEPFYDLIDAPVILVDALTREGMSGSPVLYFGNALATTEGLDAVGPPTSHPWLIGVYAGREGVTKEEVDMALGRVWKRPLLDEIFHHRGRRG